jgi:hypothetical protein
MRQHKPGVDQIEYTLLQRIASDVVPDDRKIAHASTHQDAGYRCLLQQPLRFRRHAPIARAEERAAGAHFEALPSPSEAQGTKTPFRALVEDLLQHSEPNVRFRRRIVEDVIFAFLSGPPVVISPSEPQLALASTTARSADLSFNIRKT